MKCEHDEDYQHQFEEDSTVYPIDTRCQFKCDVGYQLRGSKVRNCLPLSRWDGLKVTCKGKNDGTSTLVCNRRCIDINESIVSLIAVKCEPLLRIANGNIIPEICTGPAKVSFAINCTITCDRGFTLEGPSGRSCSGRTGIWSQRHSVNRCVGQSITNQD